MIISVRRQSARCMTWSSACHSIGTSRSNSRASPVVFKQSRYFVCVREVMKAKAKDQDQSRPGRIAGQVRVQEAGGTHCLQSRLWGVGPPVWLDAVQRTEDTIHPRQDTDMVLGKGHLIIAEICRFQSLQGIHTSIIWNNGLQALTLLLSSSSGSLGKLQHHAFRGCNILPSFLVQQSNAVFPRCFKAD